MVIKSPSRRFYLDLSRIMLVDPNTLGTTFPDSFAATAQKSEVLLKQRLRTLHQSTALAARCTILGQATQLCFVDPSSKRLQVLSTLLSASDAANASIYLGSLGDRILWDSLCHED